MYYMCTYVKMFKTKFKCIVIKSTVWATSWENLFMPYANNNGADQPAWSAPLLFTA